jgi:hypothetical protein
MKNYLTYENKFRIPDQKMITAIRNGFVFKVYWRNLGCDPRYVWKILHQRIR